MQKSKRALFVGRFQPFHLGHLQALEFVFSQAEELVVAIGSAQYSYEPDNPFSCGERLIMIRNALNENKIDPSRYLIVPLPDLHRPMAWVTWTVSLVGNIDVIFSNDPLTKRVFTEKGYEVKPIPLYNKDIYRGTEIRRRMKTDETWRDLVPKSVSSYVDAIDGVNRLKDLGEPTVSENNDEESLFLNF
jgi:nicotinamide-nucleotide adenylyltransferase